MEAANNGDEDAINTLSALCDVPTDKVFAITLNDVRNAVNEYYPYVIQLEESKRKINVKPKSIYVTTPSDNEEKEEEAKNRIIKGYFAVEITDYLSALTAATKARAKKQKQRIINENKVYTDSKLTTLAGITVDKVKDAKERKTFLWSAVNIWRKSSLFGYYI